MTRAGERIEVTNSFLPSDEACSQTQKALRSYVLAACLLAGSGAIAQPILYSNLGPGDTFLPGGYGSVPAIVNASLPSPLYQGVGAKFVAGSGGQIGSIEAAVHVTCEIPTVRPPVQDPCKPPVIPIPDGTTNAVWFTVMKDNAGVPGATLAVSSSAQVGSLKLYSFKFPNLANIQSGSTYWIRADTAQDQTMMGWNLNNEGLSGTAVWGGSFNQNPTYSFYTLGLGEPAFRLTSAVPEPGQLTMLATGIVLVMLNIKRRATMRARARGR